MQGKNGSHDSPEEGNVKYRITLEFLRAGKFSKHRKSLLELAQEQCLQLKNSQTAYPDSGIKHK